MAILHIANTGTDTMIFKPEEMLGIVDLRSLGYYKLNKAYYNKTLTDLREQKSFCEYFNNFVNTLKKEREQKLPEENNPWLDPSDE